jgi:hypothetical protein
MSKRTAILAEAMKGFEDHHDFHHSLKNPLTQLKTDENDISSQINNLINPMRLRLGIKRAFTGDINEILNQALIRAVTPVEDLLL